MARKKKNPDEAPKKRPSEAILAAFDEYPSVKCVSLMKGGRVENVLSTGSLTLDLIIGGGYQRGRIADMYGPEGSGKTTLLNEVMAAAQRASIPCTFYDFEHSADVTYMISQGVDPEFKIKVGNKKLPGFFYVQPGPGEDGYRHMSKTLQKMPDVDPEKPGPPTILLALDSLASMFSENEDTDKIGKGGLGLDARMHSTWLRHLRSLLKAKGGLLVLTNQVRMSINLKNPMASGEGQPGGNALKFYADYMIRVSASRKEGEDNIGLSRQHLYLRTIKNKCFPPFRRAELDLVLGRGLDKASDAQEFLKAIGKYEVRGGFRRIKLKQFDTGKGMSWEKFRKITESKEFREYCFELLQNERVYGAYFAQSGYKNYIYDRDWKDSDDVDVEPDVEPDVDQASSEKKVSPKNKKSSRKTKKTTSKKNKKASKKKAAEAE